MKHFSTKEFSRWNWISQFASFCCWLESLWPNLVRLLKWNRMD